MRETYEKKREKRMSDGKNDSSHSIFLCFSKYKIVI